MKETGVWETRDRTETSVVESQIASFAPGDLAAGRFRILRLLGRGGMGEVYEAEDTLLNERVALKAIRPEIASEPVALARFRHEIQLARRITHTNVCRIFDLEIHQENGRPVAFLTMELLLGETLAARLHRTGRLPLDEALALARQLATGLAAAHQCGVVHRDFKSSNVMLVPGREGELRAVITDFGLAREPAAQQHSKTLTSSGKLIGTLDYMAPEQLESGETSFRTDNYSLGLVLFEMVTGELPFPARTPIGSALRRVRDASPSPRTLRPELGPLWESVIARCLEKDPAKRFADATEVAMALGPGPAPARWQRRHRAYLAGAAVLLLLLAALVIVRTVSRSTGAAFNVVPLTSFEGLEFDPALSPNGDLAAFAWNGAKQNNVDIYVKQIASGALHRVTTDPAMDISPAWSPDGERIAFRRLLPQGVSQIMVTSYFGGTERKLVEWPFTPTARMAGGGWRSFLVDPQSGRDLCWSPDGKWLVASGRTSTMGSWGLFAISVESGETRQLTSPPPGTEGDQGDSGPALSPDGRTLAFTRTSGVLHSEVYLLPVSADLVPAGDARQITFDDRISTSPAWTADGRAIVFAAGRRDEPRRLMRVAIPAGSGSPPAERLLGIGEPADQPSISPHGRRLAYTMVEQDLNIWELRLPSHPSEPPTTTSLIASTRVDLLPDYSPDGSKIAFASDRSGAYQVWICNRDGSNPVQLTSGKTSYTGDPHWSPDGQRIAFIWHAGNQTQIYMVRADGGTPRQLTHLGESVGPPTWSRDGKWIYFSYPQQKVRQVWKIPAEGGSPVQVTQGGGIYAQESVDGKYLYYSKGSGMSISVWKKALPGGAETQVQAEIGLGRNLVVTAQGIYFIGRSGRQGGSAPGRGGAAIQFLSFATSTVNTVFTTEKPLSMGLAISPDGHSLLYTQRDRTDSDLWLVDNFR